MNRDDGIKDSVRAATSEEEIDAVARGLLSELSLDEKIRMLDGNTDFWKGLAGVFSGDFSQFAWQPGGQNPLGLPGLLFSDGTRGVVRPGTTTFPAASCRGASWDAGLEERVGDAMGREARATGRNLLGSACINLLRHPAWGRAQETFGEDTHHLGVMGVAHTRGVQNHVMACVKHFALNSMENSRFKVNVTADERTVRELYLPHFKRVVDAGVASVMSAYNSVNGEWCGQNEVLLRDILKGEWGFDGFVVTDFIFGLRDAKKGIVAGQDLEMPFQNHYHRFLPGLIESGEVPEALLDDAVLRSLRQQVRFSEGADGPDGYGEEVIGREDHRRLAREAAQKGIVLLRNEDDLLPLRDTKRIAVIGRLADTPNTGDHGGSDTRPDYVVTPLEGLRNALGGDVEVVYDDGSDPGRAASVAGDAEVAVCVVGYDYRDEGEYLAPADMKELAAIFPPPSPEDQAIFDGMMNSVSDSVGEGGQGGDRDSLRLHAEDEDLIRAVTSANPRSVVAIMAGGPVITESWRERAAAILMLWYPGMEGGNAFADILLGRVNPSGKLSSTFPKSSDDLPYFDRDAKEITYDLWHGYRKLDRDGAEPAFPFGYGLSYTEFGYDDLRLREDRLDVRGTLVADVDVTNTGRVDGEEIVQLYVSAHGSSVERAAKELRAFARVAIPAGETRTVRLEVPVEDLAYYEPGSGWVVEPITYEAVVARYAGDPNAGRATFEVVERGF